MTKGLSPHWAAHGQQLSLCTGRTGSDRAEEEGADRAEALSQAFRAFHVPIAICFPTGAHAAYLLALSTKWTVAHRRA